MSDEKIERLYLKDKEYNRADSVVKEKSDQ